VRVQIGAWVLNAGRELPRVLGVTDNFQGSVESVVAVAPECGTNLSEYLTINVGMSSHWWPGVRYIAVDLEQVCAP